MTPERPKDARAALRAIPVEARPAVIEWLRQTAFGAERTALDLRSSEPARSVQMVEGMATYWETVSAACLLLASRLETAKPKRRAQDERGKDVPPIG